MIRKNVFAIAIPLLLIPTLLAAQTDCYDRTDPSVQSQIVLDYESYSNSRPAGIIFQSPKLSLWEDHATNIDEWNDEVMNRIFGVFEDVIGRLEEITDIIPHLNGQRFGDRIQIEVTEERENGLSNAYAEPGVSRITIGWEHMHELYHRYEIDIKSVDPEFINLLHRTYWIDQFNSKLNYQTNNSPDGFDERDGMWMDAMGDLFAISSREKLESIEFLYLPTRHKPDLFINAKNALNSYRGDIQYNWNNSFNSSRVPWEPDSTGTPLLLTGMMHELYQSYGEDIFLKRFYQILPFLKTIDLDDHQAVRDNLFIASSYGANQNIVHYFNDLKWSISEEAESRVNQLVSFGQQFNNDPLGYAFDKFTYDLNEPSDLNGGDGWAHPWSVSQSSGTFNTDFSDFVSAEESAGPALVLEVQADSIQFSRPLAQSFGCPVAESTWFSFQITNQIEGGKFNFDFGSKENLVSILADNSIVLNNEDTGLDLAQGESAWFVGQFESRSSQEVLRLWMNPDAGDAGPNTPDNTVLTTSIQNIASVYFRLHSELTLSQVVVDEIKIGKSWWDISARPTSRDEELPEVKDQQTNHFDLYPNPIADGNVLHVDGPDSNREIEIVVFDLLGRKLTEIKDLGSIRSDFFSNLGIGNYFLQIQQGHWFENRMISKRN